MKSETPGHIKTKKLKMILKLPLYQVAGILEMLWNFAAICCDDGGVGRYSNEDIAAHLEWEGDPDVLINALVHCRWLDEDDVNRLVIHDWEYERPGYIAEKIRKREARRVGSKPSQSPPEEVNGRAVPGRGRAVPGQVHDETAAADPTKPNQTQSNQTSSIDERLTEDAIEGIKPRAAEIFRRTGYSGDDALVFWKAAALLHTGKIPFDAVEAAASRTRSNSSDKPPAFFRRVLVNECRDRGINADQLLGSVKLPKRFHRGPPEQGIAGEEIAKLAQALSRKDSQ